MGTVYPHITINEEEIPSFAQFDVTENTVLIPMLYARSYSITHDEFDAVTVTYNDEAERDDYSKPHYFTSALAFFNWARELHEGNNDKRNSGKNGIIKFSKFVRTGDQDIHVNMYQLDRSFVMAYELLRQGMPVVIQPIIFDNAGVNGDEPYYRYGETCTDETTKVPIIYNMDNLVVPIRVIEDCLIEKIPDEYTKYLDKNIYNLKFITSGGYTNIGELRPAMDSEGRILIDPDDPSGRPIYENTDLFGVLVDIASQRGDAIALADFMEDYYDENEFLEAIRRFPDMGWGVYQYGVACYPWANFEVSCSSVTRNYNDSYIDMPGSFAYLMAYGNSVHDNANWFAAAGVSRGTIPKMVKPHFDIGESTMHLLQGATLNGSTGLNIRVNPIMNVGTYGYRIWGNRVISPATGWKVYETQYREFLNVRMLLCDLKKQIYHAALRTTFEPNDDITWINFKSLCSTLLDKMKSGRGLSWYRWTREQADDKAIIKARLTIKPIEAVEAFDVTVFLTDQDAETLENA